MKNQPALLCSPLPFAFRYLRPLVLFGLSCATALVGWAEQASGGSIPLAELRSRIAHHDEGNGLDAQITFAGLESNGDLQNLAVEVAGDELTAPPSASASPNRPPQLTSPDQVPDGLAKSDWQGIRTAYEAGRHEFQPTAKGWQAHNPGQQWTTQFDQRGFLASPKNGSWQWGLELMSYGFPGSEHTIADGPVVQAAGQRLTYQWDAVVQEWFVNDQRGLEHGFTVKTRPDATPSHHTQPATLNFLLGVRGGLRPHVTNDSLGVEFRDATGAAVLNYTGLKVWDADGTVLFSRFELADAQLSSPGSPPIVRLLVDEQGARYPLTIDPIAQQAYLKADQHTSSDNFGQSVAVSGDTVVVGATGEDSSSTGVNSTPDEGAAYSGAAYVFVRSGTTWTQQAYLKASNPGQYDSFGASVAVSGDTVVVGANQEDSGTTGVNSTPDESLPNTGAAYVFVRSGTTWTQQAFLKADQVRRNDLFGISVAVSGDSVVVGAYLENSTTTGVNSTPDVSAFGSPGAAYVFVRNGTTWTQQAYLKASNTGTMDQFGRSVAMSGDTVVIGAPMEDSGTIGVNSTPDESASDSGAAYVFGRSGTTWTQQAYLKANNTGARDGFGGSVAVSGDTVIVGAVQEDSGTTGVNSTPDVSMPDSGAAYVFVRSGMTWTQQAYLKAINTGESDGFGISVSVSDDTSVIGALFEDSSTAGVNNTLDNFSSDSGAAYVFVRRGTTWLQQAILKASRVSSGDVFGRAVAISGDTVFVGIINDSSSTTGVNSTPDESSSDSGAASVFTGFGPLANIPPADISLSATALEKSAVADTTIGTLATTDSDIDDTHTYTLVSGTGDSDNGSFSITDASLRATNPSGITTGNRTVRIQTDDGNGGNFAKAFTITVVDDVATPSTPDLSSASDTGFSSTDDITAEAMPTFIGTAETGSIVTLFIDLNTNGTFENGTDTVVAIGSAVAGAYSLNSLSPLSLGNVIIRAIASNGASTSAPSSALTFTLLTPVTITGPGSDSVTHGNSYSTTIATTGAPTAYTATGLPNGLSVNASTGTITGNPTVSGSFFATLGASNDASDATASFTLVVSQIEQTITFASIPEKRVNDGNFDLSATASSGLAVTYTIVSGPVMISGNTVTMTGATGTVTIRADQVGNGVYAGAASLSQTFEVVQMGPLVFFGTTGEGNPFAVNIPEGSTTGTLFGLITQTGQFYILTFQVNEDRSISALSLQILGTPNTAANSSMARSLRSRVGRGATSVPDTAADLAYTFTGTLANGALNFTIEELGVTLTGVVEPAEGSTAPLAGLYESSLLNSASGTTSSIVGTTGKIYVLAITSSLIAGGNGTIATDGTFSITTAGNVNIQGTVDAPSTSVTGKIILSSGVEEAFAGISTQTLRTDRLINLSTRAYVDVAQGGALITGFVVGGTESKRVLLRAIGPSLANFGLNTVVSDPRMTIHNAAGTVIAEIDNWGGTADTAAAMTLTGAFPIDASSLDAAKALDLAPGVYTMHVQNNAAAGIALAEIYDASENPNSQYQRLINISSRGRVVGGEGVLIGGFIITGNSPKRVLIRGIGPGLTAYGVSGVLGDPRLKVFNSDRQVVATNDNWEIPAAVFAGQTIASATDITTANSTTGAFALTAAAKDSALIVTLAPGAYTVELGSVAASESGNALIEIYELPE